MMIFIGIVILVILVLVGVFWISLKIGKAQANGNDSATATSQEKTKNNTSDDRKGTAVRDFFPVEKIKDDYIETDKHYVRIAEVGSANLYAKSQRELEGLWTSNRRFFVALDGPIQINIQTRQVDISDYMDYLQPKVDFWKETNGEDHPMSVFAQHIAEFVRDTNTEKRPIRRNFIASAFEKTGDPESDLMELDRKVMGELSGIIGMDLSVQVLNKVGMSELLQGYISKDRAASMRVRDAIHKHESLSLYTKSARNSGEGDSNVRKKK